MMTAKYYKLDVDRFGELVNDFWGYFNVVNRPPISTQTEWWKRLSGYLQVDVEAAFEKMKDDLDAVPRNLPRAVKSALSKVWAEKGLFGTQPRKNYGECPECNGFGSFMVKLWHDQHKRWYICMVLCASCDNWQNHTKDSSLPRKTMSQCRHDYAAVKPGNQVFMNPVPVQNQGTAAHVRQLANGIGQAMPDTQSQPRSFTAQEKRDFVARYDKGQHGRCV